MQRPPHAGLRHLALNVRDLAAMKRFYVDLLGFAVEWEPDPDNIYLSSGIDNLALHRSTTLTAGRAPGSGQASPSEDPGASDRSARLQPGGTLDHLGVIVRDADDVDKWAEFLEGHGVTIDAKPRTHRDGARSCYFRDPDGNRVQIIHHPPISAKV
jgi:catechol 2,3-dioxygenase-like lactoylglutathione lyase family enzyme